MSKQILVIFTLFTILTAMSCQREDAVKKFPGVDRELWPLFEKFEQEAAARGHFIDLAETGITADITQIDEAHVAGQCHYNFDTPNEVSIDEEFWMIAGDALKEFIVFHELGHCKLAREHREDAYADGFCKSIMRSGVEGCEDNYNSTSRDKYLDELFDPDRF